MNIRDLFDVETCISFDVEGNTISFFFRNATAEEELEFRRRTTKQRISDRGVLESTDAALKAPMYLYTRCLKKITMQNGTGNIEEISPEDQKHIPENLKLEAWALHRSRIKKKETDDLQD
jgi:hypothetical protein